VLLYTKEIRGVSRAANVGTVPTSVAFSDSGKFAISNSFGGNLRIAPLTFGAVAAIARVLYLVLKLDRQFNQSASPNPR
jgi:hypothetical protein